MSVNSVRNGGSWKVNPWRRRYSPVRMLARLAAQIGVVAKAFGK